MDIDWAPHLLILSSIVAHSRQWGESRVPNYSISLLFIDSLSFVFGMPYAYAGSGFRLRWILIPVTIHENGLKLYSSCAEVGLHYYMHETDISVVCVWDKSKLTRKSYVFESLLSFRGEYCRWWWWMLHHNSICIIQGFHLTLFFLHIQSYRMRLCIHFVNKQRIRLFLSFSVDKIWVGKDCGLEIII